MRAAEGPVNAAQQDDFLLRQVAAVGAALARILGLRRGGAAAEAQAELNDAYGLLLETRSDLLRTVDVATAAALVDVPDAILALARLAAEEAEQECDADRRASLRLRAAALGIEALRRDQAHRAVREFLADIVPLVDPSAFTSDQRALLPEPDRREGRVERPPVRNGRSLGQTAQSTTATTRREQTMSDEVEKELHERKRRARPDEMRAEVDKLEAQAACDEGVSGSESKK